jgi:hypothetical protein
MYSMQWAMDYLDEALHGTAIRYAAEKSNLADSIAELREIDGLATTMEDPDQHREERLSPRGAGPQRLLGSPYDRTLAPQPATIHGSERAGSRQISLRE